MVCTKGICFVTQGPIFSWLGRQTMMALEVLASCDQNTHVPIVSDSFDGGDGGLKGLNTGDKANRCYRGTFILRGSQVIEDAG